MTARTQRRIWRHRLNNGTRPQVGELCLTNPPAAVVDEVPALAEVVKVHGPVNGWWVSLREVPELGGRYFICLDRLGRIRPALLLLVGGRPVLVDRCGQRLQPGSILSAVSPRDATGTERELLRQAINLERER